MASKERNSNAPTFVSSTIIGANNSTERRITTRAICKACQEKNQTNLSRRSFLSRSFIGAASLFASAFIPSSEDNVNAAEKKSKSSSDPLCKNCQGSGNVSCELCSGTGFWKALAGSNPRQTYKGTVCPECDGSGTLTCPVCLGTGEGNVRGLLRRRKVEPGPGRVLQSS